MFDLRYNWLERLSELFKRIETIVTLNGGEMIVQPVQPSTQKTMGHRIHQGGALEFKWYLSLENEFPELHAVLCRTSPAYIWEIRLVPIPGMKWEISTVINEGQLAETDKDQMKAEVFRIINQVFELKEDGQPAVPIFNDHHALRLIDVMIKATERNR